MKILSLIGLLLMIVPSKSTDWRGFVRLTPEGRYVLQTGEITPEQSYPKRGYVLGYTLHYSIIDQKSLEDVPGIGPSLAKKIMKVRSENKKASWKDIDDISGVGPKKLKILKKVLSLSD